MQCWLDRERKRDPKFDALLGRPEFSWITGPNAERDGSPGASTARHHGEFDDDGPTLRATLARVLGPAGAAKAAGATFEFHHSAKKMAERRAELMK